MVIEHQSACYSSNNKLVYEIYIWTRTWEYMKQHWQDNTLDLKYEVLHWPLLCFYWSEKKCNTFFIYENNTSLEVLCSQSCNTWLPFLKDDTGQTFRLWSPDEIFARETTIQLNFAFLQDDFILKGKLPFGANSFLYKYNPLGWKAKSWRSVWSLLKVYCSVTLHFWQPDWNVRQCWRVLQ